MRNLIVALALVACTKGSAQDTATTTAATATEPLKVLSTVPDVTVGKAPPDFSATAHDGTRLHLAELNGKPVVVYFYPKDETPGCTKEACAFRDAWDGLAKKGVVLIGVSTDDAASHKAFAEHHKLPFHLVSDPNGDLAKAFGVPMNQG